MRAIRFPSRTACAVLALAIGPRGTTVPVADSEQVRLEAAMAEVDERLLALGFEAIPEGPSYGSSPGAAGSPVTDECGFDAIANLRGAPLWYFPGEQARAFSRSFEIQRPVGPGMEFEDVSVAAITVDETGFEAVEALVDALGSPEHGECLGTQFDPGAMEVTITTEADLGVGEQSGQLNWMNVTYTAGYWFTASRVANTLVMVFYNIVGEPDSGFDPVAELSAIVDVLS